jgi:hypothetical protein
MDKYLRSFIDSGIKSLNISSLYSGGLITNYYCSSQCRHCLYGCSPNWPRKYITAERAKKNFRLIKSLDCHSIHIGGGEPFLNVDGLEKVLITARKEKMEIEYVETNSSWFKDKESAVALLRRLGKSGLRTLLISMSPFHNEHIPFSKVKGVLAACRESGLRVFPWVQEFYPELGSFDDKKKHSLKEYKEKFGDEYIKRIPARYWVHYGGRAIQTYKEIYPLKPTKEIISTSIGCSELEDTSHFHADLFGNYIPGLCSGLSIKLEDLGKPLNPYEYPLITKLYNKGIKALAEYAASEFKFRLKEEYLNKCHLCFDIRKYLVKEKGIKSKELQPAEYYDNV